MSDISAIDTYYNGYRFRSRLEARWAVFLDHMAASYQHEPEGYELGDLKYLPDFRLREGVKLYGESDRFAHVWIEVKPALELEEKDRKKIARFVRGKDSIVLILSGDPQPNAEIMLVAHKANGGEWLIRRVAWAELGDGKLGLLDREYLDSISDSDTRAAIERLSTTSRLMDAYAAARQARFEHGETPSVQPFKQEKNCTSCGQLFTPYQSYYRLCNDCYSKERARTVTNADVSSVKPGVATLSEPNVLTGSRTWMYGLAGLLIIALVITAGFVFISRDRGSAAEETPNTSLQELSPPDDDSPVSAPVRSIDLEAAACDCTENLYDCGDFETHASAQACFDACFPQSGDIHYLDANADGEACERLP